jgi:membrane fusion protein, multidrug efflux system
VLIVDSANKVESHVIQTSGTQGQDWIVDGGLNPGDRVIVQGTEKVRPGATVKAVDAQLPPPPAPGAPSADMTTSSSSTAGGAASGAQAAQTQPASAAPAASAAQ